MKIISQHPQFEASQKIIAQLKQAGHEAYLVGGCVRDALLGVAPQDLDIVTSAKPDQLEKIFAKTIPVGKSFGVILVVMDGQSFEVATFRKESDYLDGRRPSKVEYATLQEDCLRRDFTINAMYLDLDGFKVLDFVEGQGDLKKKLIRTVGKPKERFIEDHLRLLRALRFSAQLGFEMESETWQAILENMSLIKSVSGERLRQELLKLFDGGFLKEKFLKICSSKVFDILFSQLQWRSERLVGVFEKNEFKALLLFVDWMLRSNDYRSLLGDYQGVLQNLKLSREEKRAATQYIDWFVRFSEHQRRSLGELIEASFDEAVWFAMVNTVDSAGFMVDSQWNDVFAGIRRQRTSFNNTKPDSFLRASDLPGGLRPEQIGLLLKQTFWAQLAGEVRDKVQAIEKMKKLMVGLL